ncbi:MAG: hypothetical protein U9M89_02915 [Patescibacteria group bacterium]|nr:hypothetical protein [Patescibacteria group bacterium]
MKKKAIYLDVNNDLYNILVKVEKVNAEEVILVAPKDSVLFHSPVNLKILKSEATQRNKELSIVTIDPKGHSLAQKVGIPVFSDLEMSEELETSEPDIEIPDKLEEAGEPIKIKYKRQAEVPELEEEEFEEEYIEDLPEPSQRPAMFSRFIDRTTKIAWGRLSVIAAWVISSLVVLGVVAFLVIPRATINLEIGSDAFVHNFKLVLADIADKEAAGSNVFKGRFVMTEHKLTQEFTPTGEKNEGESANGEIIVFNYLTSGKPLGLKDKTRFEDPDGYIYRLQNELLIAPARNSSTPGRATVQVVAETGGSQGNLGTGIKLTIPGLGPAGVNLAFGEVCETFSGGTDKIVGVVSKKDIENAKESISKSIFNEAEDMLLAKANKNEEIISELIQNDIINIVPSAPAGSARDKFDLDIHIRSWTLLSEKGRLDDILQTTIETIVPESQELTPQTLKNVSLKLDHADFSTHIIDLTVMIEGLVAPKISEQEISESLANRSVEDVSKLFDSIPDVISHKVSLWPTWVRKMPLLESNIDIVFSYVNNTQ